MSFIINDRVQFNHIPKTGGTFARELFRNHITKQGKKHNINDCGDGFISVCIVKEPVSWWESYWNWKRNRWIKADGKDYKRNSHPTYCLFDCRAKTLDDFVLNVYHKYPMFLTNMYREFARQCDYVYVFEELYKSLHEIGLLAGVKIDLKYIRNYPIVNGSKMKEKIITEDVLTVIYDNEYLLYETIYSDVQFSKINDYALESFRCESV